MLFSVLAAPHTLGRTKPKRPHQNHEDCGGFRDSDSKRSIVNAERIDIRRIVAENNRTEFYLPDNAEKAIRSTNRIVDDNRLISSAIEIPYKGQAVDIGVEKIGTEGKHRNGKSPGYGVGGGISAACLGSIIVHARIVDGDAVVVKRITSTLSDSFSPSRDLRLSCARMPYVVIV